MLWRPPRRSWCMHRILCTACNRNSTRSFERGHDGNILEEAYRGRYARQRLLNFWPESSCGYHAIKRFVCIIQVEQRVFAMQDCFFQGTFAEVVVQRCSSFPQKQCEAIATVGHVGNRRAPAGVRLDAVLLKLFG